MVGKRVFHEEDRWIGSPKANLRNLVIGQEDVEMVRPFVVYQSKSARVDTLPFRYMPIKRHPTSGSKRRSDGLELLAEIVFHVETKRQCEAPTDEVL